jgi:3-oxoacyl-[acyl-carrier-protein] synthase-3
MIYSQTKGIGHFVPEQVVSNADFTKFMNTSDEWIQEKTGIKERRFFKEGEGTRVNSFRIVPFCIRNVLF